MKLLERVAANEERLAHPDLWGYCESGCLTAPQSVQEAIQVAPEPAPGVEVREEMRALCNAVRVLVEAVEARRVWRRHRLECLDDDCEECRELSVRFYGAQSAAETLIRGEEATGDGE